MHFAAFGERSPNQRLGAGLSPLALSLEKQESDVFRSYESVLQLLRRDCSPVEQQLLYARSASLLSDIFEFPLVKELIQNLRAASSFPSSSSSSSTALSSPSTTKLRHVLSHSACMRADLMLKTGSSCRLAGKSSVTVANLFQSVQRILTDAYLLNPSNEDCHEQLCSLQFEHGNLLMAIEEAQHAIELRPSSTLANAVLFKSMFVLGQWTSCASIWNSHFRHAPLDSVPFDVQIMQRFILLRSSSNYTAVPLPISQHDRMISVIRHCDSLLHSPSTHRASISALRFTLPVAATITTAYVASTLLSLWCMDDFAHAHCLLDISPAQTVKADSKQSDSTSVILNRWLGTINSSRRNYLRLFLTKDDALLAKSVALVSSEMDGCDSGSRISRLSSRSLSSSSSSSRLSTRRLSLNRPNTSQYDLLDEQARLYLAAGDFLAAAIDSEMNDKADIHQVIDSPRKSSVSCPDSIARKVLIDGRCGPSSSKLAEKDSSLMICFLRDCGYSVDDGPRVPSTKQRLSLQDVICKLIQTIALQCAGFIYDHPRLDISSFTRDSLILAPWFRVAFADFSVAKLGDFACTSAYDDGRFICAALVAMVCSESVIHSSDSIQCDTQCRISYRLLRLAARALTSSIASNSHLVLNTSKDCHDSLPGSMNDLLQILSIVLHCIDGLSDSPLLVRCRENNYSMFRTMMKRSSSDLPCSNFTEHRISRTETLLDLPFDYKLVAELVATLCLLVSETINLNLAQQVVIGAGNTEVVCSDICRRAARTACSIISHSRLSVNFFIRGTANLQDSADVLSGSVAQQILMSHGPSSSPQTDVLLVFKELPIVWETLSIVLRCSNKDFSLIKSQFEEKGGERFSGSFFKTVCEFPVPWKIWSDDCLKQTGLRPPDSKYLSNFMSKFQSDRNAVPETCLIFAIESWCAAFHASCVAMISDASLAGPSYASAAPHALAIARFPLLMSLSISILQLQLLVRSFPFDLGDENLAQFTRSFSSKPCPEAIASIVEMWNGEPGGRSMLCASMLSTLFRIDEILERYFALLDGHVPVLSTLVEHFAARSVGKCDVNLASVAMSGSSDKAAVAAEKAIIWADAGIKAINFQSLRMLILVANNCIICCPALPKLTTFIPGCDVLGGEDQFLSSSSVCSSAASCIALLRLQQVLSITADVNPRDVVDSVFYSVDQLCESACVSTYASAILFTRCFNHCGALQIAWQTLLSTRKREAKNSASTASHSSSAYERGTRARVSARDSNDYLQEISDLLGQVDKLQLHCLVGIVGVSHQASSRKSSSSRIPSPPTPLLAFLPFPLRCEILKVFVSKVDDEDCRSVGALLDRDTMTILSQSLQSPLYLDIVSQCEDNLLAMMLPESAPCIDVVSLIASVDLQRLSSVLPNYFHFNDNECFAGARLQLRPIPISCSLTRDIGYLVSSSAEYSTDLVVQNICAMKASSIDSTAALKHKGRTFDHSGEMASKKSGHAQQELRTYIRELISCALVSPRPIKIWRTISDVLSVQLDSHLASGEITYDFPAQSCAIGLLIAQLILLHLDASRNNNFSFQAQTAIFIARCLYFLSPAKVWTKDVLTIENCFKPWAFSASTEKVHCCRRWIAALSLSWLRFSKSCSCDELGGRSGELPCSILGTLPSDWISLESWAILTCHQSTWADTIALECSAAADDINFPVSFARVVLFYAAKMARKLCASPESVLRLLRAAHDIADPKDILGPCDIDLPTTYLVSYTFKFLSSAAFCQNEFVELSLQANENILNAGKALCDELDKCRKIGKQIHMYGLIKHCTAFRVVYSRANIDWTSELPCLHRCLINDKAARGQSGHPLIFWRPQSYAGRDWMRYVHFESSFRRVLGIYVACLRYAPLQDSISMCLRIHQRNMEQLRACSVNTAASFLSDATKIDSQTHVSVIFKSEIDNCLHFEAIPLSSVHSRLRTCLPIDKRSLFGFGVCTDAAALHLPFEEHACRSLEQGMELRSSSSSPSRWFPATFIDRTSTFEFPEEERLQLRMKFLYPEFLCCLSAVVKGASVLVQDVQKSFVSTNIDDLNPPIAPAAFDEVEALLSQLVTMQDHAHQMWQFAFMLQFTDVSFLSESVFDGIVQLVNSLTRTIVEYGHASKAQWIEFLPSRLLDDHESANDENATAFITAAVFKGNSALLALGKWREVVRNKARVERLKAAHLARKAGIGAAAGSEGGCDTFHHSPVEGHNGVNENFSTIPHEDALSASQPAVSSALSPVQISVSHLPNSELVSKILEVEGQVDIVEDAGSGVPLMMN